MGAAWVDEIVNDVCRCESYGHLRQDGVCRTWCMVFAVERLASK